MIFRERAILHFNIADFAVAVARCRDCTLRSKAVIVAPLEAGRSLVYDMSEEAYRSGVRKGMPLFLAQRLCRGAKLVAPQFELYRLAMADFLKSVRAFSPQVEYGDHDGHLFVDVTGTHRLFGPPPDIGWRVRRQIRSRLGASPIWSLSANRLVAKVASRVVKPDGEYMVDAGEEEEFLAPLPVSLLPGVSQREMQVLRQFNMSRIGQVAALSREELFVPFGRRGDFFYNSSRGVETEERRRLQDGGESLFYNSYFADDTNDRKLVSGAVSALAAEAGTQLRQRRLAVRRVGLKVLYSDGATMIRQASRRVGTADDAIIASLALQALQRAWVRRTRLRGCFLICDRLHRLSPQLPLFSVVKEQDNRRASLLRAMDEIRNRFGDDCLKVGGSLPGHFS